MKNDISFIMYDFICLALLLRAVVALRFDGRSNRGSSLHEVICVQFQIYYERFCERRNREDTRKSIQRCV